MAMDYAASAALMIDMEFRGRVKVACIKFADFILLEDASVAAHNTRAKWANQTMVMPDASASQVTPPVVMDPAVQEAGAAVTDAALQSAVEAAVNKML
jgi:hypothetical protein